MEDAAYSADTEQLQAEPTNGTSTKHASSSASPRYRGQRGPDKQQRRSKSNPEGLANPPKPPPKPRAPRRTEARADRFYNLHVVLSREEHDIMRKLAGETGPSDYVRRLLTGTAVSHGIIPVPPRPRPGPAACSLGASCSPISS